MVFKKVKKIIILFILFPLNVFAAYQYHIPGYDKSGGLESFIQALYKFALSVAGVLAMIVLIIGGIEYLTAGGSVDKGKKAKDRITNALFGLAIILLAYLILYTINPDLVRIKLPSLTL